LIVDPPISHNAIPLTTGKGTRVEKMSELRLGGDCYGLIMSADVQVVGLRSDSELTDLLALGKRSHGVYDFRSPFAELSFWHETVSEEH